VFLISMRRIIIGAMDWLVPMMAYLRAFFLPRHRLALEIVALRQQLAVFKRKQPRPKLSRLDRLFWVALLRWYSGGPMLSFWSDQKQWSPGTVLASVCSGVGSLGQRAGPRSVQRFAFSFGG
jgi:hypothetical protein